MDCLKLSNLLKMTDREFESWSSRERDKVRRHARLVATCIVLLAGTVAYLLIDRLQ